MSWTDWLHAVRELHHDREHLMGRQIVHRDIAKAAGAVGVDAVEALVTGGLDEGTALDLLVDLLDALTPLELLIGGPLGVLADEALDQVTEAGAAALREALKRDPAKLRARAVKAREAGNLTKARRLEWRAGRLERAERLGQLVEVVAPKPKRKR